MRRLGPLKVPAIGLGCMPMTASYGVPDPALGRETLEHAVHIGATFWDTAAMYGAGRNESLLAHVLKRHRDDVVLATKFGISNWPLLQMPRTIDNRPKTLRRSLEASLRRLGIEHIDLYYVHRVDPQIPIEQTVALLAEQVAAGKIRAVGLSEPTAEQLRRAHGVHPIAAVQSEWSIFSRGIEAELVPTARELGVGLVPYAPLGRGMLTGSTAATTRLPLLDYRRALPRWHRANLAANLQAVQEIGAVAAEAQASPAQVALAWLLAKGDDVVPIPGTTQAHRIDENLSATWVNLHAGQIARLDGLVAAGDRVGARSRLTGTN